MRKQRYWLQDSWGGGEWGDSFGFDDRAKAVEYGQKLLADYIWTQGGRRRWRLVERTDTVLPELSQPMVQP